MLQECQASDLSSFPISPFLGCYTARFFSGLVNFSFRVNEKIVIFGYYSETIENICSGGLRFACPPECGAHRVQRRIIQL